MPFDNLSIPLPDNIRNTVFKEPTVMSDERLYVGTWDVKRGVAHGIGVRINKHSGSIYEGHFGDGKTSGYGRYISSTTQQIYSGQWSEGLRHGHGEFSDNKSGVKYTGDWLHNKRNGYGQEQLANGTKFEGQFVNDAKCGRGITQLPDGTVIHQNYDEKEKPDKSTRILFTDGSIYQGEVLNNKMHGYGVLTYSSG